MQIDTDDTQGIIELIAAHCKRLGWMELIFADCNGDIIFGDTNYLSIKQYLQELESGFRWHCLLIFKNDNGYMSHISFSDRKAFDGLLIPSLNMTTNTFMLERGNDVLLSSIS